MPGNERVAGSQTALTRRTQTIVPFQSCCASDARLDRCKSAKTACGVSLTAAHCAPEPCSVVLHRETMADAETVMDSDSGIQVWSSKEVLKRDNLHRGSIYCLAFSPDSSLLATGEPSPSIPSIPSIPSSVFIRSIPSIPSFLPASAPRLARVVSFSASPTPFASDGGGEGRSKSLRRPSSHTGVFVLSLCGMPLLTHRTRRARV